MASKKTSREILIELGFEVNVKELEEDLKDSQEELNKRLDEMAKQAKVLQRAFDLLKIDPKRVIDGNSFEEGFKSLRKYLSNLEKQHNITFKSMTEDAIEYQRAIGGAAYESASITPNGIKNVTLSKSEAASDPRSIYYPSASGLDAVKLQTQRSTIISSALGGDKTEKELLKDSIADALRDDNDKISKFLSENIENIDNYISRIRTEYDQNGNITKAWVDFQIDEYQRMSMELSRITGTLANGMDFSAFTRTGQSVTTTKTDTYSQEKKDLQEYNNILQKQISIHKELLSQKQNSKYTSILESENRKLEEQKNTLKQNISNQEELSRLEEKYNTEISKINAKNTYSQDKKDIQEYNSILQKQISIHKELSSTKEDNAYTQVLKQENSQLEERKNSLKQNISNQKELNKLEQSYNAEISKIDAKQSVSEDADKINAAVKAKKELLKAETDLYKLRSQKADNDSIQEQSKYIDKLSDSLKKAESAQLSNGQAVSQSTRYREQANRVDEQAAETQRQLSARYKETKVSLSSLADGIQKAAKNVFQYNLAWMAMDKVDEAIVSSIEKVKELDQEMTQIQLVTGETDEQVRETINSYADLAIQLGATTQEVSDGKLMPSINPLNCGELLRD